MISVKPHIYGKRPLSTALQSGQAQRATDTTRLFQRLQFRSTGCSTLMRTMAKTQTGSQGYHPYRCREVFDLPTLLLLTLELQNS